MNNKLWPIIMGIILICLIIPALLFLVLTKKEVSKSVIAPITSCKTENVLCDLDIPCCQGLACQKSGEDYRCLAK